MKKRVFFPVVLMVSVFALAACGVKKEEVRLEALGENGALISGVNPCGTEEEVREAGIPLSEEPFDTQSDEEKGLESVTYLIQDEKFAFELAGCEVKNSFFQFVNGKLSNITMELPDGVSYATVNQEMTALYGEPVNGEKVGEKSAMTVWEFPGEYPVRAAVIGRLEEEQLVAASFQVSYVWFGDKLDAVQVHFPVKEGDGKFQEILDELTGLYGEADELTDGGEELFTSEMYLWGKDTDAARLQATLLKTKSDVSVPVAFFALE